MKKARANALAFSKFGFISFDFMSFYDALFGNCLVIYVAVGGSAFRIKRFDYKRRYFGLYEISEHVVQSFCVFCSHLGERQAHAR